MQRMPIEIPRRNMVGWDGYQNEIIWSEEDAGGNHSSMSWFQKTLAGFSQTVEDLLGFGDVPAGDALDLASRLA